MKKKDNRIKGGNLIIILLIVNLLAFLMVWFIWIDDGEGTKDKIVKCYDKKGNEIIGQQCIDKATYETKEERFLTNFIFSFFIIMILNLIGLIGYDNYWGGLS